MKFNKLVPLYVTGACSILLSIYLFSAANLLNGKDQVIVIMSVSSVIIAVIMAGLSGFILGYAESMLGIKAQIESTLTDKISSLVTELNKSKLQSLEILNREHQIRNMLNELSAVANELHSVVIMYNKVTEDMCAGEETEINFSPALAEAYRRGIAAVWDGKLQVNVEGGIDGQDGDSVPQSNS